MIKKEFLVLAVVILSFSFAASSGLYAGHMETEEDDEDIYIREYENASCGIWNVWFGPEYSTNETTRCSCTRRNVTTCRTVIVHPSTTTLEPTTTTTAAPTTGNSVPPKTANEGSIDEAFPIIREENFNDDDGDDGY